MSIIDGKEITESKHPEVVFCVTEENLKEYREDCGVTHQGWYFWDETYTEAHGPFGTNEEAHIACDKYCRDFLGE